MTEKTDKKDNARESRIATVGSPSSNYEITLDVTASARDVPLVGSVVYVENPMGEGSELALGTVSEVVTTNKWHEDPTFRGLLRDTGEIVGMSGDEGDIRRASIRIQAAWKRDSKNENWKPSGPNFRMSPATGTPVSKVDGHLIKELTADVDDTAYMGMLAGAENIPLPLSIPDFASSLGAMHFGIYGLSGSGKALALDTPIPTLNGFKPMGELQVGDVIFGSDGQPVTVTKAHDVMVGHDCYEVRFSDGSTIVADMEHLWTVEHSGKDWEWESITLTTEQIRADYEKHQEGKYWLPKVGSVQYQTRSLPIEPYAFGMKLGSDAGNLLTDEYLFSGENQREALLRGLLDTLGTEKSGQVSFKLTGEHNTKRIVSLINSLGYRASYLVEENNVYVISFASNDRTDLMNHRVKITEVVPVASVPVRCIAVDADDHLFLAGENYLPTHNTAATSYLLATQMRHENHGMIIVDPQGQWASEQELPFSLQGFAAELGRDVIVRRISEDLRLARDANLMTSLLRQTNLVIELGLKHENTQDIVWYEITKAMRDREDWTADKSEDLLRTLLEHLASDGPANRVYTSPDNATRFQDRVNGVLNDPKLFTAALHQFAPIHNLFQTTNPSGQVRHDLRDTLLGVFERHPGEPAPVLILDMSSKGMPGMEEALEEATLRAYEILEKDSVKAAVLRNLFLTLKRASEDKFRQGTNLNTLIVLDEAWRYAAPTSKMEEEELLLLSKDLAGYARDTRKFGIGWLYISQSTRSVNLDIWDQMSIRLFGYGLSGADLEKMGEIVDDKSLLRLYKANGNPRSTGVYPFMMTGPVSPLAANSTPVMLNVFTNFQAFRDDNRNWIVPIRQRLGLKELQGDPTPLAGSMRVGKPKPRAVKNEFRAVNESGKAATENRKAVGFNDVKGFADPLASLDDEDMPF